MMQKILSFLLVTLILTASSISAQHIEYSIPACTITNQKHVGDRLRLPLPKGATLKTRRDIDYEDYYIGFGEKKKRVWLSGIYGPNATAGKVSEEWISESTDVTQKTWKFGSITGTDSMGKLRNGNHWRYFGMFGESFKYYDVPSSAVEFRSHY